MESRGKLKSDPRRSQLLLDPWGILVWLKGEGDTYYCAVVRRWAEGVCVGSEEEEKLVSQQNFRRVAKKRGGRKVVNGTHPVFFKLMRKKNRNL